MGTGYHSVDAFAYLTPDELAASSSTRANLPPQSAVKTRNYVPPKGISLYVKIFEEMMNTVLKHESFLFSAHELSLFERYRELSYPARYLLVRLTLRQRSKWHSYEALKKSYEKDIGDSIEDAIRELCAPNVCLLYDCDIADSIRVSSSFSLRGPTNVQTTKTTDDFVTLDEICETDDQGRLLSNSQLSNVGSSASTLIAPIGTIETQTMIEGSAADIPFSSFAVDDSTASIPELLKCLQIDDLKKIAMDMKAVKSGMTRAEISNALLSKASTQSILSFPIISKAKSKPATHLVPSSDVYVSSVHNGDRPSLVRYNLAIGKDGKKSNQVGRLRELISQTTGKCLRVDDRIYRIFLRMNIVFFRSTESPSTKPLLPLILSAFRKRTYPKYRYTRTTEVFRDRAALLAYESALEIEEEVEKAMDSVKAKIGAAEVIQIWGRSKGRWKNLVEDKEVEGCREGMSDASDVKRKGKQKAEERSLSLQRFDEGHVLTGVACKARAALGILRKHDEEILLLNELLNQTKWRRGKRGAWYERLALVLMTHCGREEDKQRQALDVITTALKDPLVHIIYRPGLERRLARLEKRLKIAEEERHACEGSLRIADTTTIKGRRAPEPPSSSTDSGQRLLTPLTKKDGTDGDNWRKMGKSVWIGKAGNVSVEGLVLEMWEAHKYKGLHSEGRIIMHIFTLLFYDVIFLPIPGAFETPYQTAPLDLGHDTFFPARRDAIERRMEEILKGEGEQIVREVDERERPSGVWALGARWDKFPLDDVCSIVKCMGGKVLAAICRLLCQEYGQRSSGMPDLLVWNVEKGHAKFVEVKGPGDSLMENQKMWIDVLLSVDMDVEVCLVEDELAPKKEKGSKKEKRKKSKAVQENEGAKDSERIDFDVRCAEAGPQSKSSKDPSQTTSQRTRPSNPSSSGQEGKLSEIIKWKPVVEVIEILDDEEDKKQKDAIVVIDVDDDNDEVMVAMKNAIDGKRKRDALQATPNGAESSKRRKTLSNRT